MKLKLIASSVVVETERGRFSTRLDYSSGLNVVSARNNRGKTTAVMGILYALGLEGMLGPGIHMPLKPAAHELIADADGTELPVLSSYVMLEIENAAGERLTAQRWLKHDQYRRDLVRTWDAGKLTDPAESVTPRDRYTRQAGSATHEAGWHTYLAQFLGWTLPEVATYDGSLIPLYMQVFFPLSFVEQSRGWSSILGVVPRHLRIRDPGRRAVEFLLDLDANERARRREELRAREAEIAADWRAAVSGLLARLDNVGGRIEGLPRTATLEWPPATEPALQVLEGEEFVALPDVLRSTRTALAELSGTPRRADDVADEVSEQLDSAEARLARLNAVKVQTARELRAQRADIDSLRERVTTLDIDRQRYTDALKLRDLGSLAPLASDEVRCPTCEQRLPHTLHGSDLGAPVMTLEENLGLIDQERSTVRAMRVDADAVLEATRQRAVAVRNALNDARREVRALKSALSQNGSAPSEAAIARRIRLSDRLESLQGLEEFYSEVEEQLGQLAVEFRAVRGELVNLGGGGQSEGDREKLLILGRSVREQLDEYGFGSFSGVDIDLDSYLPEREGIDLNRGSSASDTVRLIWAYTVGLLEVAREVETNHPGLLVMDEPGQHEIEPDSLRALFRRVAKSREAEQQVLIATSMPSDEIESLQGELDFRLHPFADRVLVREP